jgi:hypothetical protein
MIDSMEEELNALWQQVETITGTKYLKRKIPLMSLMILVMRQIKQYVI